MDSFGFEEEDVWGSSDAISKDVWSTAKPATPTLEDSTDGILEDQTANEDDFGDFDDEQAFDEDGFGDFEETTFEPEPEPTRSGGIATTAQTRPINTNCSPEELTAQIQTILTALYPDTFACITDDPDQEVTQPSQILSAASSTATQLFKQLDTPPETQPVQWKRSKTRKLHLTTLGVPLVAEEWSTRPTVEPSLSTLSISSAPPSRVTTPTASVSNLHATTAGASIMRSASPAASSIPVLDRRKASQLLSWSDDALQAEDMDSLKSIQNDLEELVRRSSEVLSFNVDMLDRLRADSETYDQLIQDLVSTAQKLKPSNASSLSRSGSLPSKSKAGRFFGGSKASRPSSPVTSDTPNRKSSYHV